MPKVDTLNHTAKLEGGISLDKLAQLPTNVRLKYQKIAGKKYATYSIVSQLAQLNTPLKKQYINTLNCTSQIVERNGTYKTKLCRNRCCSYCNNVKTANLINGYEKEINIQIDNKKAFFVTLTRKNVSAENLRFTIQEMHKNFSNITRVLNEKRNWKISGIRSVEVTYNENCNTYHPHLHIIIWGDNMPGDWQKILLDEWQNRYGKLVSKKAQDIRIADKGSFKELFKYVTKMTVNKSKKGTKTFYPQVIDNTLQSLKGLRTIQSFGSLKKEVTPPEQKIIVDKSSTILDRVFYWNVCDWHTIEDNGCIIDFTGNKQKTIYTPLKIPLPIGDIVKKYVITLQNSG